MIPAGSAGMEVGRLEHRTDAAARLCEFHVRPAEDERSAARRRG
jgi:hypothetical protein